MTAEMQAVLDAARTFVARTTIDDWHHHEDCALFEDDGDGDCVDDGEALRCSEGCHVCDCYVSRLAPLYAALDAEAKARAAVPAVEWRKEQWPAQGIWLSLVVDGADTGWGVRSGEVDVWTVSSPTDDNVVRCTGPAGAKAAAERAAGVRS